MLSRVHVQIVYDNTTQRKDLAADWGFACLIEAGNRRLLFDTGARGDLLLANMRVLGINMLDIGEIFVSHYHWDHTGGLPDLLALKPDIKVWAPRDCENVQMANRVEFIDTPRDLGDSLYSTGTLADIEHSLVIRTERGVVVVVGCSHPGVGQILDIASSFGKPYALVGGFHGFDEYERLEGLDIICPTHCTQHIEEIKQRCPDQYVPGGAGTFFRL